MPGLHPPDAPASANDAAVGHHDQEHAAVAVAVAHAKLQGKAKGVTSGERISGQISATHYTLTLRQPLMITMSSRGLTSPDEHGRDPTGHGTSLPPEVHYHRQLQLQLCRSPALPRPSIPSPQKTRKHRAPKSSPNRRARDRKAMASAQPQPGLKRKQPHSKTTMSDPEQRRRQHH